MAAVLGAVVCSAACWRSRARSSVADPQPRWARPTIGFATGAYTGALIALTVIGTGAVSLSLGALVGGLATAVVVYLLAYRRGMQGFRLIIVGIAVTAMLQSVNLFLALRAQEEVAMAASIWGAGSLSLMNWGTLLPAVIALAVCLPGLLLRRSCGSSNWATTRLRHTASTSNGRASGWCCSRWPWWRS